MSETIGGRLRIFRSSKGLTQTKMADELSVKLRAYQSYEGDEGGMGNDKYAILGRMGIDLHWLLTGEERSGSAPIPQAKPQKVQVLDNSGELAALKTQVSMQNTVIAALQDQIAGLKDQVAGQKDQISTLRELADTQKAFLAKAIKQANSASSVLQPSSPV